LSGSCHFRIPEQKLTWVFYIELGDLASAQRAAEMSNQIKTR
jgi:hypothetical protein